MSCLKIGDLYAFLEGELSPIQRENIEGHLSSCPRCREALAERRLLSEAALSLPDLEIPADFTEQVMAAIVPVRRRLPVWLIATAAGLSSLMLLLLVAVISGEENLLTLLARLNHSFWGYAKNAVVLGAKLLTLLSLTEKVLGSLSQPIFKGLSVLTSLLRPGGQVFLMIFALVVFVMLFYFLSKKLMMGEKT